MTTILFCMNFLGDLFFRGESFIEHQDTCTVRRVQPELQAFQPAASSSRTASSTSPSSGNNFGITPMPRLSSTVAPEPVFLGQERHCSSSIDDQQHNLELQLLPSSSNYAWRNCDESQPTNLKLSIGSCSKGKRRY